MENPILVDARWNELCGIGRFSREVIQRLKNCDLLFGPRPLSIRGLLWQNYHLKRSPHKVYYSPGFNPVNSISMPYLITVYDLIHIENSNRHKWRKNFYFEYFLKPTVKKAQKIITVSEYSKQRILRWSNISEEKVINVGSGVSSVFKPDGKQHLPGYPYLLHVGNTKQHKNVARLIDAFALAKLDANIKLICTGQFDQEIKNRIYKYKLQNHVLSQVNLNEHELACYYRGALGVVFPSLCEGFGLPVVEGMACGVPILTSNCSSLSEIAGNAAILIEPDDVESIKSGIENLVYKTDQRKEMIEKGLQRSTLFSWQNTTYKIQSILDEFK